jgi:hypothetical protein
MLSGDEPAVHGVMTDWAAVMQTVIALLPVHSFLLTGLLLCRLLSHCCLFTHSVCSCCYGDCYRSAACSLISSDWACCYADCYRSAACSLIPSVLAVMQTVIALLPVHSFRLFLLLCRLLSQCCLFTHSVCSCCYADCYRSAACSLIPSVLSKLAC